VDILDLNKVVLYTVIIAFHDDKSLIDKVKKVARLSPAVVKLQHKAAFGFAFARQQLLNDLRFVHQE